MANLVKDIKKEFREFWELPISCNGELYKKIGFDSKNISLIFECLTGEQYQFLSIVYPDDPSVPFMSIIEGLLSLLKSDFLLGSSEVLVGINPGDSVVLINERITKPGIYLGKKEDSDGVTRFYVMEDIKTKDAPVTHGITLQNKWRIQPYQQANTIKNKRQSELFGEKLERILGLPAGGLLAFQKSRMLFIPKNKSQVKEELLDIRLGGDSLISVFPVADYLSEDCFNPLGSDPLRRKPTCGLISNVDVAVDLALKDNSVKLIIIDGASKIRSHYGSLERLKNDTDQCKAICLLNPDNEEEIEIMKNLGSVFWVWKRKDFQKMEPAGIEPEVGNIVSRHNNIMSCLAGEDPGIEVINAPDNLNNALERTYKLISKISDKTDEDNLESAILLRWSISLINSLLQLPLPLKDYQKYTDIYEEGKQLKLDGKLNALLKKVNESFGFSITADLKNEWEELLEQIMKIYSEIEQENPKWEAIIRQERKGTGKISLLCFNENYANALRKFHQDKFSTIISASEAGKPVDGKVLVTGWHNRKTAAKLFLAPYKNYIYIFYPHENQRFSYVFKTHPASPVSKIDSNFRVDEDSGKNDTLLFKTTKITDINNILEDIEKKFAGSLYKAHLLDYGEENMTEAQRIIFEDDVYCYSTEFQELNRLDRENKSILKCHLKDLSCGDELVYAESQRGMFEELLLILKESEQYKILFSEAKLWHEVLTEYLNFNDLNEEELQDKLSETGCQISLFTIKSWIRGELISPSEKNLRDLSAFIDNSRLNNNLEKVINAVRKIHSLHIQTGQLLVRKIINAVVQSGDITLESETKRRVEEYSKKARIVSIREISSETINVPAKAIGKLFEM